MKLNICTPKLFKELAGEKLTSQGVRNSLMLGILNQVLHDPARYPGDNLTAVVTANDQVPLAALRTPPYKLLLHADEPQPQAMRLLADFLLQQKPLIPGVLAEDDIADVWVEMWSPLTGAKAEIAQYIRLHELTEVQAVPPASGHASWLEESDFPVLSGWIDAFLAEATPHAPKIDAMKRLQRCLGHDTIIVWRDPEPVAMAMRSRPDGEMTGIGLVYTPPEKRKRGYATALVAELSKRALAMGFKRCTLYTDLANPISNSIYAKIGYKPVSDWKDYLFTYGGKETSC